MTFDAHFYTRRLEEKRLTGYSPSRSRSWLMGDSREPADVTQMLKAWGKGDADAGDRLFATVDRDLRQIAASYMRRERGDQTMEVTALINESYLRLVDQTKVEWQNRSHFFGIAARCMRRVLVDRARRKLAQKRPQPKAAVPVDEMIAAPDVAFEEILAVHDALDKLEAANKRQAQVAELKYFGGLTIEEIAEALSIAPATVKRDWKEAEIWLRAALRGMLP